MYRNASELKNEEVLAGFDICIVGAGAAGIAVAKQLLTSKKKVLVLCSGDAADFGPPAPPAQESIYQGTLGPFMDRDDPEFLTRSRLRMYGGTTNHFGFWAAPLTEADLRSRPGYRNAHWPFGIDELNRYYPDANTFGNYGPFNYDDIDFWAQVLGGEPFPAMPGDQLQNAIFHAQYDATIKDFQIQFGPLLKASQNVTVLFNSNVLEIATNESRSHVVGLGCATIENGKRGIDFRVDLGNNASCVLAQGGIEPVRLLKISTNLGDNGKEMLGRGFMVHPLITDAARVSFSTPVSTLIRNFFKEQQVRLKSVGDPSSKSTDAYTGEFRSICEPVYDVGDLAEAHIFQAWGVLAPTPEAMDRTLIGDFRVIIGFNSDGRSANINFNWEQVPNEDSTITLDRAILDPVFGQPVVKLDWNLLEEDKRTIRTGLAFCDQYLRARGGDKFEVTTDLSGGPENWTFPPAFGELTPGDHHMGALRMSQEPGDGIVDPNCRFHTVKNLYAAGSGVFPTSGYANPTLTIVALALRLADYLEDQP